MFFLSDEMPFSFDELLLFGAASGGKAIEDTATGNPLVFLTDLACPLKSLLVNLLPVQSGSGDPSPQNIRPIVAWDEVKVWNGGKNLFNGTNVVNGYFSTRGSDTIIYSASAGRTVWCPCKPDTVYAISKMTGGKRLAVYVSEEEPKVNTVVYATQRISGSGTDVYVFRTPSNAKYICAFVWLSSADTEITAEEMIASVQIEVGETATAYEPYKPITETDISFPSPVYGGTLDAVSGVLTDKYADGELVAVGKQGNFFYTTLYSLGLPNIASLNKGLVCDRLQNNANTSEVTTEPSITVYANGIVRFVVPDYIESTWQEFNEATKNDRFKFAYEVAEPQEIQLTPQQITALKGNNTLWSDADGSMTAIYLKKG